MIESISIKKIATFDDTGIQINDLKKVNFVYGANGCGKTTISNYLLDSSDVKFANCTIKWKNAQEIKTLVYNKVFRERNFGKGKLNGVFTLGEATTEEVEVIEEKVEALKLKKNDEIKKRETLDSQIKKRETLDSVFKEFTWTKIYKKYEIIFKEAFVGSLNKEKFRKRLLQESANNTTPLGLLDELKAKAKTIFGEVPQNITPISIIDFSNIIEIENNSIWKKIVVGKADVDIAKLIQKLNINDWINQGRDYLQENDICPFCQQKTITTDFKTQLESFFDESYLNDIKLLKGLKLEYNYLTENLINELNTIEIYQKDFKNTKLNIDKYSAFLKTLISQNATNTELLNNKVKEPSRSIEMISLKEQLDLISELIKSANDEIAKHNGIVANYISERNTLINSIWKYIIDEFNLEIIKFNNEYKGLQTGINSLNVQIKAIQDEYKLLDAEIKKLSKNVTSIQPAINEMNRLLESYGFTNFKIVPANEDAFYQIQREDGAIADTTLSEGEITFITFLYYLQLAKGGITAETVKENRILIIDDPISSLDSNILFLVSSLIKEIIKEVKSDVGNIKQLILLTHNVYFHKEVSFIDGRTKFCEKTNYWILRKNDSISEIQSFLISNPIQSSYELLWQELRSEDAKLGITIQNIMRRIIENYFKLLGKYGDDDLIQKFENKEEREICRSLICWINDGSHSINDDLYIELQDRTIENYKKVFRDIFLLTNHEGHYNMMMGRNAIAQQ